MFLRIKKIISEFIEYFDDYDVYFYNIIIKFIW